MAREPEPPRDPSGAEAAAIDERPTMLPIRDLRRIAEDYRGLRREGLGVYGLADDSGQDEDHLSELVMMVEAGMPDDFLDVLRSAVPEVQVRVLEVEEFVPLGEDPSGVEQAAAEAVQGSDNAGWDHLDQVPGASDAIAVGVGHLAAGLGVSHVAHAGDGAAPSRPTGEEVAISDNLKRLRAEAAADLNGDAARELERLRGWSETGRAVSSSAGAADPAIIVSDPLHEEGPIDYQNHPDPFALMEVQPGFVDDMKRARAQANAMLGNVRRGDVPGVGDKVAQPTEEGEVEIERLAAERIVRDLDAGRVVRFEGDPAPTQE
ncbi:MAG: hypothetical protein AAB520_03290 [Patescibacteria group bacterium]